MRLVALAFAFALAALFVTATYAATQAPALSPMEQLKLDNLGLKAQLTDTLKLVAELKGSVGACELALGSYRHTQNTGALSSEEKALKAEVDAAHPGFTWDPRSGVFTPTKAAKE